MSKPTPFMRVLAERIIASEKLSSKKSERDGRPVVAIVSQKLRPVLGMLMGNEGYRALLSRALARATVEAPPLQALYLTADGALIFDSASTPPDPKKLNEGSVILVPELLGLLTAFIGEDLTAQYIREAWPRLSFKNNLNSDPRDKK
jgi:hypothetical protein